jgi:hypothetical protein
MSIFQNLTALLRQTTGRDLSAEAAFTGLTDFGLFAEKMPPCFTSEGLSNQVSTALAIIETETNSNKLRNLLDKVTHSQIRYQSLRDINIPRHLAIPHPESYLAHCLVIKRCWRKIKTHCAKPSKPVSRIFVRQTGEDRIFKMNYKGSERFEVEEEEIGYQTGATHMVKADISKCFPSIYTHSIPWAIHGKATAKKNRDLMLEGNLLDRSCQILADSQTNGLAIGPHSSNVISEIILTKIDTTLLKKGYARFTRHIDDYTFYARSHQEAERFVRDLNLALREYELYLNEKKTQIVNLPQPASASWVNELSQFTFPDGEIRFSTLRSFLDLALELTHTHGTSAVLNYAIKMIPKRLNDRAKRLFTLEATNLCLAYPYLAPIMEESVFARHRNPNTDDLISTLANELINTGIEKIHPDSIAHALYLAIEYDFNINLSEDELKAIIMIDDCLGNVLLWEYANRKNLSKVKGWLRTRANNLKSQEKQDHDAQWLLIYTIWSESDLRGNGQNFLADLKRQNFEFTKFSS